MKGTTRRMLGIGALVFVVLLVVGLWPRHVFMTRTEDATVLSPGQADATWSASADCSILLGEFRVETYRMPPGAALVPGDLCGDPSPARVALVIGLVLVATATMVALLWTSVTIPEPEVETDEFAAGEP